MQRTFVLKEETHRILRACFAVYNHMGSGFLEPVYQECLAIELAHERIPFQSQPPVFLTYRGQRLNRTYEPDFVCFESVIVEIKAVSDLADEHRAQILNYLHATGLVVALLINFGHHFGLQYERFIQGDPARHGARKQPDDVGDR